MLPWSASSKSKTEFDGIDVSQTNSEPSIVFGRLARKYNIKCKVMDKNVSWLTQKS